MVPLVGINRRRTSRPMRDFGTDGEIRIRTARDIRQRPGNCRFRQGLRGLKPVVPVRRQRFNSNAIRAGQPARELIRRHAHAKKRITPPTRVLDPVRDDVGDRLHTKGAAAFRLAVQRPGNNVNWICHSNPQAQRAATTMGGGSPARNHHAAIRAAVMATGTQTLHARSCRPTAIRIGSMQREPIPMPKSWRPPTALPKQSIPRSRHKR